MVSGTETLEKVEIQLKLVTFLLPEAFMKSLDELIDEGLFPTRSAAIRFAVRELLRRELWRRKAAVTTQEALLMKLKVEH